MFDNYREFQKHVLLFISSFLFYNIYCYDYLYFNVCNRFHLLGVPNLPISQIHKPSEVESSSPSCTTYTFYFQCPEKIRYRSWWSWIIYKVPRNSKTKFRSLLLLLLLLLFLYIFFLISCFLSSGAICPRRRLSGPDYHGTSSTWGGYNLPIWVRRLNHPDYIRWAVQTMKFLIVEPSPLPILIPLGSKYLSQDPVFKYP